MPSEYSVKISRRDGVVEIVGPDQAWVDTKLQELASIYNSPGLDEPADPPPHSGGSSPKVRTSAGASRRTSANPSPRERSENGARSAKPRRRGGRPQRNPELESQLTRERQIKLKEYIEERQAAWDRKHTNQAAIIAAFLFDELEWPGIDEDDLYTVYRVLALDGPTNFRSLLQNAYGRDKYFRGVDDGKYTLSLPGETFGRTGSKA